MEQKTITMPKLYSIFRTDIVFYTIAFSIPFFFKHPQILVGTAVNTLLFLGSLKLSRKQLVPLIILPSIGTTMQGVLFGAFTPYLIFMMPFIWIGNGVLVYVYRRLFFSSQKKCEKGIAIIFSSVAKSLFLFISAFILYKLQIVPSVFLSAMGMMQIITALGGGILAYFIYQQFNKVFHNI